jgi:hypothetical protein
VARERRPQCSARERPKTQQASEHSSGVSAVCSVWTVKANVQGSRRRLPRKNHLYVGPQAAPAGVVGRLPGLPAVVRFAIYQLWKRLQICRSTAARVSLNSTMIRRNSRCRKSGAWLRECPHLER